MNVYLTAFFVFVLNTNLIQCSLTDRLDCYLEYDFKIDKTSCEERGCIWDTEHRPNGVPICYLDPKTVGYRRVSTKTTATGVEVELSLKETARRTLKKVPQIENLKVEVNFLTDRILRVKIIDPKNARYEVPIQTEFPLLQQQHKRNFQDIQRLYSIEFGNSSDDFNFAIIRNSSQTKLFDTSIGGLIYGDQLLQIATRLPTKNVYGLGENTHHSLRHDFTNYETFPLFSQDHGTGQDQINLYGVHPFYTCLESDGKSHGILLLNSNAMDYTLLPEPGLNFRTIGGVLDLFVFIGDNPEQVVQLYTSLIGRPILPPFWGLGYQLTRWGFSGTDDVRKVIDRNIKANVPLDVMYLDIDYMDQYHDFSYDKKRFAKLPELIDETKSKNNLHWTLIIDPAIEAVKLDNPVFQDGYDKDVYIKYDASVFKKDRYTPSGVPTDKGVIYGKVWPKGPAAFPDFFKNVTHEWWQKWVLYLHNDLNVKFDALWIDMNEPANLIDKGYQCPHNKYDYPEARIKPLYGNDNVRDLGHNTICMLTVQGNKDELLHYNVHSLYGLSEMIATQKAIHAATGKRGFAVSRSTYVSSGRYGTHWLGDNSSQWPDMKYSIIGILEFNLFGISFVGPDICGFGGNTTPELCKRWHQLGAFYPFSRNHNCIGNIDQDPAVWAEKGHPEVTQAAINSFKLRYKLLPYLYTLYFMAHTAGQTVARPVFHEFAADSNTHAIDEQFMLGPALLVSPFLYQNQTEVKAYLPNTVWYEMSPSLNKVSKTGHVVIQDNKQGIPPVHLRGGFIVPVSSVDTHVNSRTVRNSSIDLLVLPDNQRRASGDLFWDDGDGIDTIEKSLFNLYSFNLHQNCSLDVHVINGQFKTDQTLASLQIYGTNGQSVSATLDGQPIKDITVTNQMTQIKANIVLGSKKKGDKWTVVWKSSKTGLCNIE